MAARANDWNKTTIEYSYKGKKYYYTYGELNSQSYTNENCTYAEGSYNYLDFTTIEKLNRLKKIIPSISLFHDPIENKWNIVCLGKDGEIVYYNEHIDFICLVHQAHEDIVTKND